MIIPEILTANILMDRAHSAFVSTRSMQDVEEALICVGRATSTLTKTLETCMLPKPNAVDIKTAHGATTMSATHQCLKTYYVRDHLGETRPIFVKAYFVPGLKRDQLSDN